MEEEKNEVSDTDAESSIEASSQNKRISKIPSPQVHEPELPLESRAIDFALTRTPASFSPKASSLELLPMLN